jgi:hypothetical protein
VALNQVNKSCELVEASHRGGVRFWAGALARTASISPGTTIPKQRSKPLSGSLKQSYTRLSGLTQAGISGEWQIPAALKNSPIHIDNCVSFLTDRSLHQGAASGLFAFLVSKARSS